MSLTALTDADFDAEVIQTEGAVLVDFWAPWCGPCRAIHPILEELDREQESLTVLSLNVDENSTTSSRYQVMSIPTMLLFKNGQLVKKLVGAQPKRALEAQISDSLA